DAGECRSVPGVEAAGPHASLWLGEARPATLRTSGPSQPFGRRGLFLPERPVGPARARVRPAAADEELEERGRLRSLGRRPHSVMPQTARWLAGASREAAPSDSP